MAIKRMYLRTVEGPDCSEACLAAGESCSAKSSSKEHYHVGVERRCGHPGQRAEDWQYFRQLTEARRIIQRCFEEGNDAEGLRESAYSWLERSYELAYRTPHPDRRQANG